MSKKYSYVRIDESIYKEINRIIEEVKSNIDPSNIGYSFSMKKKELEKGISRLFNLISREEIYNPIDGKLDIYDVDNMGNSQEWTKNEIEKKINERGYGITHEQKKEIIQKFQSSKDFRRINAEELNSLKSMISSESIKSGELEFVKKAQFVSKYIQIVYRNYGKRVDPGAVEENGLILKEDGNKLSSIDDIYDKGKVIIKGNSIDDIATEMLKNLINESRKGSSENHIQPRKNPTVSYVCGLPGLGKSSVYINGLRRQGVCCLDLDEIALNVAKRYGVSLNERNQNEIYKIAGAIHDCMFRKAISNRLDVAVERIGYNKQQVVSLVNNTNKILDAVNKHMSTNINYTHDLLMVAGTSVNSTINNSIRLSEQIFEGEEIRGYTYDQLLLNNDCTIFSYLDCLQDEHVRSIFSNMKLGERGKSYDSFSVSEQHKTLTKENGVAIGR